jgi:hypothetical protein
MRRRVRVLVIRKNKKVLFQIEDQQNYVPNYEVEKDKPNTLYVLSEEDQNKLEGGNLSGENLS